MANKTNKSFSKRIKLTKSGKLKIRKIGQNHFNAKESGRKGMRKRKPQDLKLKNKQIARFIRNK